MLAAIGASAVLAETTEIFGAEHLLVRRARNRQVAEKLLGFVEGYKQYLTRFAGSFNDNPSPGNKEGGLTNILEKSLGAVAKAGTSPLTSAVDYAEPVRTPGFVFMNTPGYDPASLTGLACIVRLQPDRVHHRTRQRHRLPFRAGAQDFKQQQYLSAHAGQYGYQCRLHRRWREKRCRCGP